MIVVQGDETGGPVGARRLFLGIGGDRSETGIHERPLKKERGKG